MFNSQVKPKAVLRNWGNMLLALLVLSSCSQIDLYEKTVAVPGHAWKSSFKPSFKFTIKDTTAQYQPFIVLRHTDRYNFNNIYINLFVQLPNGDTIKRIHQDLELGNDDEGWKGEGMDDIYEHRIPLGGAEKFNKGDFIFTVGQVMRQDPLQHVLDVGVRIEKK